MKIRRNSGFTLIEILVVIGIIAVLAAIVLIALNPARQFAQARNSQRTSNVNAILNAIGQYIADNQGVEPTIPGAEVNIALCQDLTPEYLPALPTDPDSGTLGADIDEADCGGIVGGSVGYEVTQDGTTNRITVSAPLTELCSVDPCPADEIITVTR